MLKRKRFNTGDRLLDYRVLDLSDMRGFLCGKLLGDLGADVIKVEKPGGDPSRRIGPFYKNIPHPEKSLSWFAYNSNKRGITLNIETEDGRRLFRQLVERADVVIETFTPGYMKSIGLGYNELSNSKLIMTSITPFGQDGPQSHYKDGDGVTWSMGGMTYVSGDPDRPPVRVSFPQSYSHAGAAAALGTMLALFHRDTTGEGQYVDVSIQECVTQALMNVLPFWDIDKVNLKRAGQFRTGLSSTANQRLIWECKDGAVNYPLYGGMTGARSNRGLTEWMNDKGMGSEYMNSIEWEKFDMGQATQDEFNIFEKDMAGFFKAHTMEELYNESIKRRVMLYPVYSIREIVKSPQLEAREFWEKVEHPELGDKVTYPGAFAKFSDFYIRIRRRAPLIGEHNEEIYCGELGLSKEDLILLKQANVI